MAVAGRDLTRQWTNMWFAPIFAIAIVLLAGCETSDLAPYRICGQWATSSLAQTQCWENIGGGEEEEWVQTGTGWKGESVEGHAAEP